MQLVLKDSNTVLWARSVDLQIGNPNTTLSKIQEILDRVVKEIEAKSRETIAEDDK